MWGFIIIVTILFVIAIVTLTTRKPHPAAQPPVIYTTACEPFAPYEQKKAVVIKERFLSPGVTKSSGGPCQFQSDAGMVCPLMVQADDYQIMPYTQQPESVQKATQAALNGEWGDHFTDDYLRQTWADADVLYVATDANGTFAGCMAVDRKKFFPFISHLIVDPRHRSQGYGSRLLQLGEDYARTLTFTEVKLWCEPKLVPYYVARGYRVEEAGETNIMTKGL